MNWRKKSSQRYVALAPMAQAASACSKRKFVLCTYQFLLTTTELRSWVIKGVCVFRLQAYPSSSTGLVWSTLKLQWTVVVVLTIVLIVLHVILILLAVVMILLWSWCSAFANWVSDSFTIEPLKWIFWQTTSSFECLHGGLLNCIAWILLIFWSASVVSTVVSALVNAFFSSVSIIWAGDFSLTVTWTTVMICCISALSFWVLGC